MFQPMPGSEDDDSTVEIQLAHMLVEEYILLRGSAENLEVVDENVKDMRGECDEADLEDRVRTELMKDADRFYYEADALLCHIGVGGHL